jgi:predicted phosphodiesterase
MKIRLYSDVHTEFHADGGRSFVESLDPDGADLVVLAGDVSDATGVRAALVAFAERFRGTPVCYVTGNHEFYLGDRNTTWNEVHRAVGEAPNLHWLNGDVFETHGRRVLGTTLWFYKSAMNGPHEAMNDFRMIGDFRSWVFEENRRSVEFLRRELREGDVVVTHYLPSEACVSPRFRGSALNPFFVCDVTDLILERKPALWLFGHTHDSVDVRVGATRLVCNPFGYARRDQNPRFDEGLTIEL